MSFLIFGTYIEKHLSPLLLKKSICFLRSKRYHTPDKTSPSYYYRPKEAGLLVCILPLLYYGVPKVPFIIPNPKTNLIHNVSSVCPNTLFLFLNTEKNKKLTLSTRSSILQRVTSFPREAPKDQQNGAKAAGGSSNPKPVQRTQSSPMPSMELESYMAPSAARRF